MRNFSCKRQLDLLVHEIVATTYQQQGSTIKSIKDCLEDSFVPYTNLKIHFSRKRIRQSLKRLRRKGAVEIYSNGRISCFRSVKNPRPLKYNLDKHLYFNCSLDQPYV